MYFLAALLFQYSRTLYTPPSGIVLRQSMDLEPLNSVAFGGSARQRPLADLTRLFYLKSLIRLCSMLSPCVPSIFSVSVKH